MGAGIKWDMREWRKGIRATATASKRVAPTVVNETMHTALLRAAELTPAAIPARIEAGLRTDGLLFKVLQSPTSRVRLPRQVQGMIVAGRGVNTRAMVNAAATMLLAARKRSVAYIRAGWIKAARAFGGAPRQRVSTKGLAGKSWGKRATVSSPVAAAANMARGAETVGAAAFERALDEGGRNMVPIASKQLTKAWK